MRRKLDIKLFMSKTQQNDHEQKHSLLDLQFECKLFLVALEGESLLSVNLCVDNTVFYSS